MLNRFFRSILMLLARLGCALGMVLTGAQAQGVAEQAEPTGLYATAQQWVDASVSQSGTDLPLRLEVVLGQLDPRLKLAPCARVEPYLPPGTQLWGKTRLGLRCVQGTSKWNVFLPLTVKAFGPAWVIKGQVASGTMLQATDAMEVVVDWAEGRSPIVAKQTDWVGKTATRLLSTNQPLRQDMVRASQVFQAGAQVRVVAAGTGFEIVSSGQALSAGVVGQGARVRMDNGQVLSGVVGDDRVVRIVL